MTRFLTGLSALVLALSAAGAAEIPDRPEKLAFPPLTYEPPDPAEFRVPLKAGPVAYVVPDRTLPLVNIQILVRCGSYLEPGDKTGLAGFTGALLVRGGTASQEAEALEERLAFLAAGLGASIGDDSGTVSLNLLSKDLPEGLAILREVLTAPRFQADKLELQRDQVLQSLRQRNDDSSTIEAREALWLSYGTNFWAARQPTADGVRSITREDLQAFHRRWFHPANFTVAASGDFDRDDLVARLETLFADWPFTGAQPPPVPVETSPAPPGVYLVDKDVNQGRLRLLLPGVRRDHPDFPAIQIMNDILGGGGFTARLMNRVRSDEGLAYGAYSAFHGGVHFARPFQAGLQTKSRTVAQALDIVTEEIRRIRSEPVSEEEIETAKRGFIDTFPGNFNTRAKVAALFASDEFTGRYATDPRHWKEWRDRHARVTLEEVLRVAREHLHPDRAVVLVVGQKAEILKGHPDHPASLESLSGGRLTELPLRDPLTLEPLTPAPRSE